MGGGGGCLAHTFLPYIGFYKDCEVVGSLIENFHSIL